MAEATTEQSTEKTSEVVESGQAVAETVIDEVSDGQLLLSNLDQLMPQNIRPYWDMLQEHPVAMALMLLVVGLVLAKIVQWVFSDVLHRLTQRSKSDLDDRLILLLSRPVFITVLITFLLISMAALQLPVAWDLLINRVLLSMLVFSWTLAGSRSIGIFLDILKHIKDHFKVIEERTMPLFNMVLKGLVVGISVYLLLNIWGIDATAWLASAGIVGIAVGFAAKDTLANVISGISIVADAPYTIGDYINLDSGERGMVTHVGLRSTRLITRDDIEVNIPNAIIANSTVINESGGHWVKERIRLQIGVAYGSDVDRVCSVLKTVALELEHIVRMPEPVVRMRGFGAYSLDFELMCWIDEPALRGRLRHYLYMAIYKRFKTEGILIPYPTSDMYIKQLPDSEEQR